MRRYAREGALLAEREIAAAAPSNDAFLVVRGEHIFAAGEWPGEALILDGDMEVVFEPGLLWNRAELGRTRTGFFAMSTDDFAEEVVLTFLDDC